MPEWNAVRMVASPEGFAVYDSSKRKLAAAAVDVMVRPGVAPMLMLALAGGNVDVQGNSLFAVVDPLTGKPKVVTRIEWADGTASEFPAPEKVAKTVVSSGPVEPLEPAPPLTGEALEARRRNRDKFNGSQEAEDQALSPSSPVSSGSAE
jgi:hypothetical protein